MKTLSRKNKGDPISTNGASYFYIQNSGYRDEWPLDKELLVYVVLFKVFTMERPNFRKTPQFERLWIPEQTERSPQEHPANAKNISR